MARSVDTAFIATVCVSFIINIFVYPHVPDLIATHWNGQGVVDTYMMKGPGLFMITLFLAMFALIFIVVPKLPHLKPFAARYYTLYCIFSTWLMGLIFLINIHVVLWNAGILKVQPIRIVAASFLIPLSLSIYFMARRKYPQAGS
jgi:uncharacterized membrane protein